MILISKSSILVGGQAVIEGVMMRVPGYFATAVRNPNGKIVLDRHEFISLVKKNKKLDLPIIRGAIHLFESLKIGMQTLQWSADIAMPEDENAKPQSKFLESLLNLVTILFAIGLFIALPIITAGIVSDKENSPFTFNLISGGIRILLFLVYLVGISFIKDVKRLFEYHGAEHKAVYTFEAGLPLNVSETKQFPTQHPRCGTSFLFIVMIVAIISFGILDSILLQFIYKLTAVNRILFHIPFIPFVAGVGYEVLKLTAKYRQHFIFRILSTPGLWLQLITTKIPDDDQANIALEALKHAFGEELPDHLGQKYVAEAIA